MIDLAKSQAILKQTYADGVTVIDYKKHPTLARFKKAKGKVERTPFGEAFIVPIQHGLPQTENASFTQGQTNASNYSTRYGRFTVTPVTNYGFAQVSGDVVRRATGEGAFVDAMSREIDNASKNMTRQFAMQMFRQGYGERGVISASANLATTTLLLANPWMVRFFEKDQNIVFASTVGASVLRTATPLVITGRDANLGTLTLSATPNSLAAGIAVGDSIFQLGDRQNSATPARTKIAGFPAWIPTAAPSPGESFFGQDRSTDSRLYGLRWDATRSGSMEEAFLDGMSLCGTEGGSTTDIVVGPETYTKFVKSLTTRTYIDIPTDDPKVGFRGIEIHGGSGSAVITSDPNCPEGEGWVLHIDNWTLMHAEDDLVTTINDDGLMFRRVPNQDAWQTDLVSCAQLVCDAPGHQCRIFNLDLV